MTRHAPWLLHVLLCSATLAGSGCLSSQRGAEQRWALERERSAGPAVLVQWTLDLVAPFTGAYVPVEPASPATDASTGRVYVGTTLGQLFAFDAGGRQLYRIDAKSGIEAQPVVDSVHDALYAATVRGDVLALHAQDGSPRWTASAGAPISQPGLLSSDALYLVADDDSVVALSRSDGTVLWRYHREPHEGLSIAGHAGLVEAGGKLITAFGDGAVVALDASDGRVLWETDTSVDLGDTDAMRRFTDVDTTPAIAGDIVYVASFSGGLYGLELASGTVHTHEADLHGITAITATQDALLLSSADDGVVCLDLPGLTLRWRHAVPRGAPGRTEVHGDNVYVAESLGALLALSLADGHETGRLESAHGFTSAPAFSGRRGFALSNAAKLYAFNF